VRQRDGLTRCSSASPLTAAVLRGLLETQTTERVNLVNAPFTQAPPVQTEETPFWRSPELLTSAKEIGRNLLIACIALYLVLGVLRPMLRSFASAPPSAQLTSPPDLPALDGPAQAAATYEANLQAAKQIARQDPKLVANVVRGWVTNDG